ncbi:BA14K family protein [Alsobacter sp. SYSU M60028]|uniref:Lectin-like protein BA14k n=1 Tax=Alsobacter ponti TaxID=2962936 RepID=A0ABT1L6C7_9HYPH|nr:BA14K family protein [Alsobacter ponti]MCP8936955.1 BA14K family protein [Alsobacter ponti]
MFGAKPLSLLAAATLAAGLTVAAPAPQAMAQGHSSYGEGGDPGPRQPGMYRWNHRGAYAPRYSYGVPRYNGRNYAYYPRHRYYPRYGYYRHGYNPGAAAAAGIIGLTTGAIIGNALSNHASPNSCYRYKSYNPSTGTYLGYDGRRHYCP